MEAPLLALFGFAGVINAWSLGVLLLVRGDLRRSAASVRLALFLIAVGILLAMFILWYFNWMPYSFATRIIHDAVALATGALFADHIACALGRSPLQRIVYAPAPVYLLAALVFGQSFVESITIAHLVCVQISYSAAATFLALSQWRNARVKSTLAKLNVAPLIAGLWIVHAAQLLRILLPDSRIVFETVPWAGAVVLIAINVYALGDSRTLRRMVAGPAGTLMKIPLALRELEVQFRRDRLYLHAGLTAEDLAGAAGITSRQLSTLLNRDAGCSFYEFVRRYRVAEAQRLLCSPAERRTSIEAIGLMAGFRSRSTFYDAFRRATGASPAQFRREQTG